MRCAIMQPTYLPWIGYFNLMDQVDTFVLLDNVQFSRGSWQQRNRVKTSKGFVWLSVPVTQKMGSLINEVKISDISFMRKHLETIRRSYSKAKYLSDYFDSFQGISSNAVKKSPLLHKLNEDLIHYFYGELGIDTELVNASRLEVSGKRTNLLTNICSAVGARTYISPPASFDYLKNEAHLFEEVNIDLLFYNYEHPEYPQLFPPFISHLSVVDLLLNKGPDSMRVVRSGKRKLLTFEEMKNNNC